MTPREPAERQLERVLHAIPLATRPGGASLDELSEELGVSAKRILADLEEVTARAYYLEAPVDIEISIETDRVTVWTTGEFRRPVRLSNITIRPGGASQQYEPMPPGSAIQQ